MFYEAVEISLIVWIKTMNELIPTKKKKTLGSIGERENERMSEHFSE